MVSVIQGEGKGEGVLEEGELKEGEEEEGEGSRGCRGYEGGGGMGL